MAVSMGLIKDRHGKVPERLREPVSRVLGKDKQQQVWLQKSTRTKIKAEARRLSLPIMAEFAETLQKAEGLLAERPLRTTLTQQEIDLIGLPSGTTPTYWRPMRAFITEGAAEDETLVHTIADHSPRLASSTIRQSPWGLHQPTRSLTANSPSGSSTWRAGCRS
jgi:hypothetical protein